MVKLVGLPDTLGQLVFAWAMEAPQQRFGKWVWNKYGVPGVDGKSLEKDGVSLFHASHEQAVEIMREYYSV